MIRATTLLVFAPLLLNGSIGNAQSVDWNRVHEVTVRGVNLVYNLEMERAITTFDTVTALAPNDPRGHFFKSMVHFWTYTLTNEEADFQRFMALSDTVVTICEQLLDRDEDDAVAHFYLGGIRGYRGMAQQVHGSILKAVMEGRIAYNELEEAVRLQPNLYDAHMGFGLFRYLLAKIPRGFAWVVRLVGYEGDLEGGLQSLRLAATKGIYTRSEATFYLAQFLFNEHRGDEAFPLLQSLIRRHPDNTLFLVIYSSWRLREGNLDEALAAVEKADEINKRKNIKYGEQFVHSTRASIAYTRNDFAVAKREYDLYLSQQSLRDMVPNFTYYRIAVARDIMGDRKGAVEVCNMMKEEGDANAYRRGRELAAHPLTEAEIRLIQAGNAFNRKDYDSSAFYYRAAVDAPGNTIDLRLRAMYGVQQANYEKGDDAGAVSIGMQIVGMKPQRETWVIPNAWFKLAQSYRRLGRLADASAALDRVEDYNSYDNQDRLEERVEEERKQLEQR